MVVGVATRRFTVDEFHRMVEAGILDEDDRLELVDGEIIEMTPIGGPHSFAVNRLNKLLTVALQDLPAIVSVQNPVRLPGETELYPDLAIVADIGDVYRQRIPEAGDVHLIIEVADSSLAYDRRTKASLYARAGIRDHWIVDVSSGALEVYRSPSPDGYSDRFFRRAGESVALLAFPAVVVAIDDFLG